MKRIQKFLALSMVIMSVFALAAPALAAYEELDYFNSYAQTYGPYWFNWSQEEWQAVQSDLERRVDIDKNYRFTQAVLRQQYGTPDAQAISMENAIEAAIQVISETNFITDEGLLITKTELETNFTANALYLIGVSQPIWKITFSKMLQSGPYAFDLYHAEVNAYTGEVRNFGRFSPGEFYYAPFVLFEVLELIDKEMPAQPELPSNG